MTTTTYCFNLGRTRKRLQNSKSWREMGQKSQITFMPHCHLKIKVLLFLQSKNCHQKTHLFLKLHKVLITFLITDCGNKVCFWPKAREYILPGKKRLAKKKNTQAQILLLYHTMEVGTSIFRTPLKIENLGFIQ